MLNIPLLIPGILAIITALGVVIVNIIVALRTSAKIDLAVAKVDVVNSKADVITGHVNSAAASSAAKIAGLEREVEMLKLIIFDRKEIPQPATIGQK